MPIRCVHDGILVPLMDDIDRQIVALLRQDARRSFQSIGLRVSLSAPAVKRRVDRLEADGVIRGYTARVDPGRFGWNTHALVALYCEGRMAASEVREAVERHPEVEAAYTVAGEASAVVHVRARDTAHLEETLERIRDHAGRHANADADRPLARCSSVPLRNSYKNDAAKSLVRP